MFWLPHAFLQTRRSVSVGTVCGSDMDWAGSQEEAVGNDPQCSVATSQQAAGPSAGFPGCQSTGCPSASASVRLSATIMGRLGCVLGSGSEGFLEAGSVCVRSDPIAARSALSPLRACVPL